MLLIQRLWHCRVLLLVTTGPVLLLAAWALAASDSRQPAAFQSPRALARVAEAHGLFARSSSGANADIGMSCYLSDHPLQVNDIANLRLPIDSHLTHWRGIVLVAFVSRADNPSIGIVASHGRDENYRMWGRVLATGDPELLDRLEAMFGPGDE